jgi:hypothetical protein
LRASAEIERLHAPSLEPVPRERQIRSLRFRDVIGGRTSQKILLNNFSDLAPIGWPRTFRRFLETLPKK